MQCRYHPPGKSRSSLLLCTRGYWLLQEAQHLELRRYDILRTVLLMAEAPTVVLCAHDKHLHHRRR